MGKENDQNILNFIFEAGVLKRLPRTGWHVLGIAHPESVADHSFRCAVIAYCLAKMESLDASKAVLMALFNDLQEARIGDLHKMSQRYFNFKRAEKIAAKEQIENLPDFLRSDLGNIQKCYEKQKDQAAIIARDADILECLLQAKEYELQGAKDAKKFMKKGPGFLVSTSAKRLWQEAQNMDINLWWEKLSEFQR